MKNVIEKFFHAIKEWNGKFYKEVGIISGLKRKKIWTAENYEWKSKKATSGKIKLIKIYSMLRNPISNNLLPCLVAMCFQVLLSFIKFYEEFFN